MRLTNLGIRQVSPAAIEAARAFGSTRRQLLLKVQLPLAIPSILTGVNQTIMMALGMVVIAALIGAGGLGREVLVALQRLQVGQALEAGLAIVILAIMLDRLSAALVTLDMTAQRRRRRFDVMVNLFQRLAHAPADLLSHLARNPEKQRAHPARRADLINCLLLLVLLLMITTLSDAARQLPAGLAPVHPRAQPTPQSPGCATTCSSSPARSATTRRSICSTRRAVCCAIGCPGRSLSWSGACLPHGPAAGGWRCSRSSGGLLIGLLGMWEPSMDTLSQVLVTMVFTIAIALPLGILLAQNRLVRQVLRPVLDFLQTIPPFVYLVPVIMLFNIGRVPGADRRRAVRDRAGHQADRPGHPAGRAETVEASRVVRRDPPADAVQSAAAAGAADDHARHQPDDHDGAVDGDHRRAGRRRGAGAGGRHRPGAQPSPGAASRPGWRSSSWPSSWIGSRRPGPHSSDKFNHEGRRSLGDSTSPSGCLF